MLLLGDVLLRVGIGLFGGAGPSFLGFRFGVGPCPYFSWWEWPLPSLCGRSPSLLEGVVGPSANSLLWRRFMPSLSGCLALELGPWNCPSPLGIGVWPFLLEVGVGPSFSRSLSNTIIILFPNIFHIFLLSVCFSSFVVALRPSKNWQKKSKGQKKLISGVELDQFGPKNRPPRLLPFWTLGHFFFSQMFSFLFPVER